MRFRRSCIVNKLLVGRGGRYLYKIFESLFRTASDYQFRSTKVWQPWAVGDSPDIRSHLVPVGAEGGREGKKENIPRKPGPGGGVTFQKFSVTPQECLAALIWPLTTNDLLQLIGVLSWLFCLSGFFFVF